MEAIAKLRDFRARIMKPIAAPPRPVSRLGPLQVRDGRIVAAGETVRLSGVSLFWTNLQPRFFDAATIGWLAQDWRPDIVRVPIGVAPEGPAMKLSHAVALARQAIDAAIDAGLYAVIDWHAHEEQQEALPCLAALAQHYGDIPNIIYEPWNEPAPEYSWSIIGGFHRRAVDAVREHAPSALVVVGTPEHCRRVDIAAAAPLGRANIAYSLHFYAGTHREGLRERARRAIAGGLPLMATEWGVAEASGGGTMDWQETRRWLAFLAAEGISDIAWSIANKDETCAALVPSAVGTHDWPRSALTPTGRFLRARLRRALR